MRSLLFTLVLLVLAVCAPVERAAATSLPATASADAQADADTIGFGAVPQFYAPLTFTYTGYSLGSFNEAYIHSETDLHDSTHSTEREKWDDEYLEYGGTHYGYGHKHGLHCHGTHHEHMREWPKSCEGNCDPPGEMTTDPQPPASVPEPANLVLWSQVVLAGSWLGWRRRRA